LPCCGHNRTNPSLHPDHQSHTTSRTQYQQKETTNV
jgi:hypothetical protein